MSPLLPSHPVRPPLRRRLLGALGVAILATGTGACAPASLDGEMATAASRACASLIERRVAGRAVPYDIAGVSIDIREEPERFYEVLTRERGPDEFDPADPATRRMTRASITGSKCDVDPTASSSSDASSTGSSATASAEAEVPNPSGVEAAPEPDIEAAVPAGAPEIPAAEPVTEPGTEAVGADG